MSYKWLIIYVTRMPLVDRFSTKLRSKIAVDEILFHNSEFEVAKVNVDLLSQCIIVACKTIF